MAYIKSDASPKSKIKDKILNTIFFNLIIPFSYIIVLFKYIVNLFALIYFFWYDEYGDKNGAYSYFAIFNYCCSINSYIFSYC